MNTKLLKQKILNLAIRGKLTDQRKSDGTARELLEQISASSQPERSTKSAKSKDPTPIIPLNKSEAPFEIPDSWEWIKLGDVGNWQSGTTPSKSNLDYYRNGTIPWLNTGDLNDGVISQIPKKVTEKALKETSLRMNDAGSVCIAMYGATIGKLGILAIPATTNQACCVCNKLANFVERMWLFYFLMFHKQEFIEAGFGGAQPNISKEKIVSTAFPLPPLVEQQRIVEKIEEAFAEIDAVEKNKELLKTHIKQTRQKILDLAIHGKLVPQDENDEPASVLLEKILQEKAQTDNKKSPKKKKIDDIATSDNRPYEKIEDIPFEIPESWRWVRMDDINDFQSYTENPMLKENKNRVYELYSVPCFEVRHPEIVTGSEIGSTKVLVKKDDVLISKINPHLNRVWRVPQFTEHRMIASSEWVIIRNSRLNPQYLVYVLQSNYFLNKMLSNTSGVGGSLTRAKPYEVKKYELPIPPLNEQSRIVSKIEELYSTLDQMEQNLI